jgi:hypothetical protein
MTSYRSTGSTSQGNTTAEGIAQITLVMLLFTNEYNHTSKSINTATRHKERSPSLTSAAVPPPAVDAVNCKAVVDYRQ